MNLPIDEVVVASDSSRDAIGVEIYKQGQLIIDIYRQDSAKVRTITLYEKDVALEFLEESIRIFKDKIPWHFIDELI